MNSHALGGLSKLMRCECEFLPAHDFNYLTLWKTLGYDHDAQVIKLKTPLSKLGSKMLIGEMSDGRRVDQGRPHCMHHICTCNGLHHRKHYCIGLLIGKLRSVVKSSLRAFGQTACSIWHWWEMYVRFSFNQCMFHAMSTTILILLWVALMQNTLHQSIHECPLNIHCDELIFNGRHIFAAHIRAGRRMRFPHSIQDKLWNCNGNNYLKAYSTISNIARLKPINDTMHHTKHCWANAHNVHLKQSSFKKHCCIIMIIIIILMNDINTCKPQGNIYGYNNAHDCKGGQPLHDIMHPFFYSQLTLKSGIGLRTQKHSTA